MLPAGPVRVTSASQTLNTGQRAMSSTAAPVAAAEEVPAKTRLECVERVMRLPVVEAALSQSAEVYGKVKASSPVLAWTLGAAEATVAMGLDAAAVALDAAPVAQVLSSVDGPLCRGLSAVQDRLPIVNEPPQQIYETTKNYVTGALMPTRSRVAAVTSVGVQKAKSLKELSWNKANELLSTQYGSAAISGLDRTASLAERYLDYYFPPAEDEKSVPVTPAEEDKVAHTIGTVGHVYTKLARRCYHVLSQKIRTLNKDNVQEYLSLLLATIHLTNYLNTLLPRPAASAGGAPSPAAGEPAAAQ